MSPIEIFMHAPPISRTLTAITFTLSVLVYVGLLDFSLFNLQLPSLIKLPPELWRIFTSLFITWPNFGIVFDTYFLYTYGSKLEIASPRFSQRADFFTYICFCSVVILLLNILIGYGNVFASPLALCFITSTTRDTWDQPMILLVLKMPSQYFPYALLFLTLIVCSPQAAMIQATGVGAAHLYDFLSGLYPNFGIKRNLISSPGLVKRVFGTQTMVERPYGTANMPGVAKEAAWGLDLSWKRFGPGRTLGGDGSASGVERQRPTALALAAMVMVGFLVVCGFLAVLFVQHGDPRAWFSGVNTGGVSQIEGGGGSGGGGSAVSADGQ
ncbi:Derlin [Lachnellula subtilissima]|uniref:Derlin n=1 Tax=Lachnellula subtilissima TaxID=602034 RepID=A0A8H8RPV0_9HELO|nr:Derlin [Lachnellula subtilissima]